MGISADKLKPFILYYGVGISIFHFWINIWGGMSDLWFNAAHFSLLASLGYLTFRASSYSSSKTVPFYDFILALLTLSVAGYMMGFEESLYAVSNAQMRPSDVYMTGLAIFLALEMVRRATGLIIPALMLVCIGYILWFGKHVAGVFAFGGMSVERFFYRMFYTGEGLFGSIATISSTYVFMFILFAAFLLKSGAGDFIVDVSRAFTSRFRGGAGHVAVFSSALMGTISGSAVANTVSTGSITIPMMKKNGFKPIFAAGVETAASTGGQIMPPIMGAGAFIMAQMTNIPFATIVAVSVLPAILYFASIAVYIHIHAKENNLEVETEEIDIWPVLREGFHFIIPLATLVGLLVYGFTPTYAAGISIIAIIASSYLTKYKRMGIKEILEALSLGSQNMVITGVLLVSVGIIVGVINISGIGIIFSQLIMEWSGGKLIIAMILVALASLVLGMGLPVTASYVVLAVLSAPALVGLMLSPELAMLLNAGLEVPEATMYFLSAHLIIFWLSQDSNLTPPVCLAAFAAAGIAGTSPMRTGVMSWKLGKGLYIVPLLFAFTPLITGTWAERVEIFAFSLGGLAAFAIAVEGFWDVKTTWLERLVFAATAVLLFTQDSLYGMSSLTPWIENVHILGVGLFVGIMALHKLRARKVVYARNHQS
ncbi:TRAP transporter fused permease subunit [Sulfurospirillum sp. T05]|uniref:TRAP transporter fused permease subunit n=1 Tax=Sulfurospirillum tamanense TaxID=2813362 RepID=A0ABS2WU70_9BACT|nr:TRAP transporter fused permease subunit [Sulfurospirillum tamanensis]MBN2965209.1 TRAP transporter fused permease subunit [Sulfurospirillum tamanensis]